jgi:hypothetical protein
MWWWCFLNLFHDFLRLLRRFLLFTVAGTVREAEVKRLGLSQVGFGHYVLIGKVFLLFLFIARDNRGGKGSVYKAFRWGHLNWNVIIINFQGLL